MMLAGAAELGLVSGKLKSEWWKLCVPAAFAVAGAAFLIHEANPWLYSRSAFVHHACGWIAADRRAVPARGGVQAALAAVRHRLRDRVHRGRGRALQLPRRCTCVRAPQPLGGGGAPVKRLLLVAAVVALALPASASAHATLLQMSPAVGQRLAASPHVVRLTFDQSVTTLPNGIRVYDARGRLVSGAAHGAADSPRAIEVTLQRLPRGAYTVRWSDDLERQPRRARRVHVRRPREGPGAEPGVRRDRPDDLRAHRPLAVLHLPRAADGRSRVPAVRASRRHHAGGGAAVLPAHRRGRGRGARGRDRRVPAAGARTRFSCRSRRSCTATCRPSRTTPGSARRSW